MQNIELANAEYRMFVLSKSSLIKNTLCLKKWKYFNGCYFLFTGATPTANAQGQGNTLLERN